MKTHEMEIKNKMEGSNKSGDLHRNMERYWINKFSSQREKSYFPYDFEKSGNGYTPAEKKFQFPAELFSRVKKLSRESDHRLHMILAAGIAALLNKYTGNNDITIAVPNYKQEKQDEYINTALPLRNEINPAASFKDLLLQVRQSILEAVENQNYPLDLLVHHLKNQAPGTDASLFHMAVLLENIHDTGHIRHLNLDMCFSFNRTGDSLDGTLRYNAALYLETSIHGIIRHFIRLLEDAVFNIDARIHHLEMLSGEEIKQHIFDFNNTAVDYPGHKILHALFTGHAEQTPDHMALLEAPCREILNAPGQIHLSYRKLHEQSDRLACLLREKGIETHNIVGLMTKHSIGMIVGIFGILKAGAAYMTIDPHNPARRLPGLLADTGTKAVITTHTLAKELEKIKSWQGKIIFLDELSQTPITRHPIPPSNQPGSSLAAVAYISEPTGESKGILIRHNQVTNYAAWLKKEFQITEKDRFCFPGSSCFDRSATSLTVPLLLGAAHLIPGDEIENNPRLYTRYHAKNRTSILKLSFTRFKLMSEFSDEADLSSLRRIILKMEAADNNDIQKYLTRYPRQRIVSEYETPETTGAALFYVFQENTFDGTKIETPAKEKKQDWHGIPIGMPISNTRAYILDKYLNILPIGVAGELFIGSTGLSMGYLNQPELTSEKFCPQRPGAPRRGGPICCANRLCWFSSVSGLGRDMSSKVPGKGIHRSHRPYRSYIFYKTNSLARRLPDGNIELLGNIQPQVIINGSPIEPQEIENRLKAHDYVLEAVVTAREKSGGGRYLCAYFVGVSGNERESSPAKLREFLANQLPGHMIPSYFVRLEEIPLTPGGKLDGPLLPEPDEGSTGLKNRYIPPQTEQDRLLSEIWGEILETENVGLYDNFFDLGGNSIHAISVISQVHKEFGDRVPISMIFKHPTISELGKVLRKGKEGTLPAVQRCPPNDYYPLSHSQMRLWFFTQMEPDNPAYNVPSVLRIKGDFDPEIFKKSWDILVHRHEALRTSITVVEKKTQTGTEEIPVQIIHDTVENCIKQMDLSDLPREQREEKLQRIVEEEGKRPFNLEQAPLYRVISVKLEDREYVLGIILHHIISDNWSSRQITREFTYFYHRLKKNLPAKLPPLEFHYKDFAYWQNQILSGKGLEKQKQYWHEKLGGQLPVLDLRTDFTRPALQSSSGDQVTVEINPHLTQHLKQLSRKKLTTLFMILTIAFKAILYRYTNQEDIIIGTLIAGRSGSGLEKIIGYFVNILALRDQVTGNITFEDFLGQVKRTMMEAYDNQDYPFDKLVDELKVERNLGRSPVFDILLVYQNIEVLTEGFSSLKSLKISPYGRNYVVSKYDIYLDIFNYPDFIRINVEFCTDLFKKETIEKMFRHYLNLLRSAVDKPGSTISSLEIMTEEEKKQLLEDFNHTHREIPGHRCYHELFQEQVRETPERIAVSHMGETLTYDRLNQQANRMAHCLSGHGIEPGKIVAIYMKRSINMLASILGIFKAGGGYMPIEVNYPMERTRFLLRDSKITVIIADTELNRKLEEIQQGMNTQLQVLRWENGSPAGSGCQLREYPIENPAAHVNPHDYAYMIYTSGTTGHPKGVLIHQQGMINHLYAKINDLTVNPNDRVAQTASQCFDISVWQFLAVLLKGGAVIIFDFEIVLDPGAMLKGLQEEKITILESVPSLMSVFLDMLENNQEPGLDHLRWMILTGEALKPELVQRWFRYYPGIKLVNAYGPTEASDDITHYIIHKPSDVGEWSVPIGKPVQNMRIYILDKDLSLCPVGVRGEICVAGIGVGKGYWEDPGKTNRAFIANPYAPGGMNREYAVLYKTGDIGYFRDDGNIECQGRIDNQVKIRGFRIELEEIEAIMNRHPAINECAVIVKKKQDSPDAVVGFFVEREPVDPEELKRFLLDYLPGHMIPAAFIKLQELPLAISGKTDRQALAAMDIDALSSTSEAALEFVAPRTQTEKIIAEIWTNVLKKKNIGIDDNYFDIGGHSLLVPRIHRKLEKQFPGKCKIADLFEYMTISQLARHIEGDIETGEEEIIELSID